MAPIRWAASAPLLPPLRHLTRSIVQSNSECVSEITRQRRIRLSVCSWMKVSQLSGQLYKTRPTWLLGHWSLSRCGATWLGKGISDYFWLTIPYDSKFLSAGLNAFAEYLKPYPKLFLLCHSILLSKQRRARARWEGLLNEFLILYLKTT